MTEVTAKRPERRFLRSLTSGLVSGFIAAILTASATIWIGVATNIENARLSQQSALNGAINAIGGPSPAQRAAGVSVARSLAIQELVAAENPDIFARLTRQKGYDAQQALATYQSAVILSIATLTLPASGTSAPPSTATVVCATPASREAVDEADDLKRLLDQLFTFRRLGGQTPSIDLSNVNLCGQPWSGINIGELNTKYFVRTDLESSNLRNSNWRGANLAGSHLECGRLQGAQLQHVNFNYANLRDADLSGADINGATFVHTNLSGVKSAGIKGAPSGWPSSYTEADFLPDPHLACGQ